MGPNFHIPFIPFSRYMQGSLSLYNGARWNSEPEQLITCVIPTNV